jgi:hypothetical protein
MIAERVVLDCDKESLGKQFLHFEGVCCLHFQKLRGLIGPSPWRWRQHVLLICSNCLPSDTVLFQKNRVLILKLVSLAKKSRRQSCYHTILCHYYLICLDWQEKNSSRCSGDEGGVFLVVIGCSLSEIMPMDWNLILWGNGTLRNWQDECELSDCLFFNELVTHYPCLQEPATGCCPVCSFYMIFFLISFMFDCCMAEFMDLWNDMYVRTYVHTYIHTYIHTLPSEWVTWDSFSIQNRTRFLKLSLKFWN